MEIKKIFPGLLLPLLLSATDPVFYMPLDGTADVLDAKGSKIAGGIIHGRSDYQPGIVGQGINAKRWAYDQATAVEFKKLPAVNMNNGTVAFWFKPDWTETDKAAHCILNARDTSWKFRFYLVKNAKGMLDLSLVAPKHLQIVRKVSFKQNEWTHLAFTWNQEKSELIFYKDGKLFVKRTIPNAVSKQEKPLNMYLYFGNGSSDRFKAQVGNGIYDEFKLFDKTLSADEIFSLTSGGQKEVLNELSMNNAVRKGDNIVFAFKNKKARLSGPKKLLSFSSKNSGDNISITAMGASGKLSMIVNCAGKLYAAETSYTLQLNKPHRIAVEQDGNKLIVKLDDAVQKVFELSRPFGKIIKAEGAETVTLLAPSIVPSAAEIKRLSDTTLSKLENGLWSLNDAEKMESGVRKGVTLNAFWRVYPVNDYSYAPPQGEWGYTRVPGSFRSPLWQIYRDNNGKLASLYGKWQKKDIIQYRAAWYQRIFEVPAELKGKRVYLNFKNLNANAGRVYLNGKLIHEFRRDGNYITNYLNRCRIDVTDHLANKNVLTLFLDRDYSGLWMGKPAITDFDEIAINDVWLEKAPSKLSLRSGIAMPSFRQMNVTLRSRIQNPAGLTGKAELCFDFERNGKIEKSFRKNIVLDGKKEQLSVWKESWNNPVLWNIEEPNIYNMTVSLKQNGKVLDTLPVQNFGFREIYVQGSDLILNGKKTRLRMYTSPAIDRIPNYYAAKDVVHQHISYVKTMNYDTVRFNPFSKYSSCWWEDYLNASDRQGLYNLFPMPPYEDDEMKEYTQTVEDYLESYGQHPSILMWYTDFNTCSYPWNQDPAKLTDRDYLPERFKVRRARTQIAEKVMRAIDPSRELFQHAGGNSGKIFTSMNYQSFGTPLQEQEDWPKQWFEDKSGRKQPLMVVESAFPYPGQFWHFGQGGFGPIGKVLSAEHAARYFGDSVFADEDRPVPYATTWMNSAYAPMNANMQRLGAMLYNNVVKAWRAYDMSALGDFPGGRDLVRTAKTYDNHNVVYKVGGNPKTSGLKPDIRDSATEAHRHPLTDYSRRDYLDKQIRESFAPMLIFLAGTPEDFTNKDHAFFSGEKFCKSIVVVNDRVKDQNVTFRWELVMNGKVIQQGEVAETVAPSANIRIPINLTAPEVYKRTDAELRMIALKNNALIKEDSFALQFFPKRVQPDFSDVSAGLYDPAGKTEAVLKLAGFPYRKVKTLNDVKKCRLLIIGAYALGGSNPELLKQIEEAGLIENGLKILIFEQKECNLANLVFESPSYRNAFIRCPKSPLVAGLKNEDFSNWRGAAESVPAFVLSNENSGHYPRSKWKCGNGGIVSGNVIRKPSYGNFKTIVDCGFNVMFASLMELRKGHGYILFCQLDVTNRFGKDPVATKLVDNILSEMGNRFVPVGPQRVGYLGDDAGEAELKKMGMEYTKLSLDNPWAIGGRQIVIVGANSIPADKLKIVKNMLEKVSVIYLPDAPAELYPDGIRKEQKLMFRASAPVNDPVFEGVTNADLYFRKAYKLPVMTGLPDWAIKTEPAIMAKLDKITTTQVFLTLAPSKMDGFWGPEKMARAWNTIFDNMNIGLGKDLKLFTALRSRHNKKTYSIGEIEPENAMIRFDLKNNGKVSDTAGYIPVKLGIPWEDQGHQQKNPYYKYPANTPSNQIRPYDGYAWYRCTVDIPESWRGHTLRFTGGPIDDSDWTYWNGTKIGETLVERNPKSYMTDRNYIIPSKLVKFGEKNTIAIRVYDRWGFGGVTGPLKIIAEDSKASDSWSPYIKDLDFYDVDAFRNW